MMNHTKTVIAARYEYTMWLGEFPHTIVQDLMGDVSQTHKGHIVQLRNPENDSNIIISKGDRHSINLLQIGKFHMRGMFEKGQDHLIQYFYSGSAMVCRCKAKRVDFLLGETKGFIDLLYEVSCYETHMGTYNLLVEYNQA